MTVRGAWLLLLTLAGSSCTSSAPPPSPTPRHEANPERGSPPADGGDSTSEGFTELTEEPPPPPARVDPPAPVAEAKAEFTKVAVKRQPWSKLARPAGVWLAPPPESLLEAATSSGKPVMLISTQSGLWLQAWDAPWRRQLTATTPIVAVYDPRTAIVLYTADDQLWAIDLAAEVAADQLPVPAPLAKDVWAKNETWLEIELMHADGDMVTSSPWPGESHLQLSWEARPSLIERAPKYPPDDWHSGIDRRIERSWLTERKARQSWKAPLPRASVLPFAEQEREGDVADLLLAGRCPIMLCGASLPLGASSYEWVLVNESMGDVLHFEGLVRERAHDGAEERWIGMPGFMTFIAAGAGQVDFVERSSPEPWPVPSDDAGAGTVRVFSPGTGYVGTKEPKPVEWFARNERRTKIDETQTEEALRFDVGGELFLRGRGASRVCSIHGGCIDYDASVLDFLAGNVDIGPTYSSD